MLISIYRLTVKYDGNPVKDARRNSILSSGKKNGADKSIKKELDTDKARFEKANEELGTKRCE